VPAALLLVLAGTVLHVTSDVEARAVEIARLRGLGLSRRDILGGLLAQHGGILALLVLAGAVVGAAAAVALGPPLILSDVGAAPVPPAVTRWPWAAEGLLLAVLLAACGAAVALVVSVQVRRADAAHLRVGP
jgi:predicted lysophospholipase L1 biosynthesis ABC-type transport system permease subunit